MITVYSPLATLLIFQIKIQLVRDIFKQGILRFQKLQLGDYAKLGQINCDIKTHTFVINSEFENEINLDKVKIEKELIFQIAKAENWIISLFGTIKEIPDSIVIVVTDCLSFCIELLQLIHTKKKDLKKLMVKIYPHNRQMPHQLEKLYLAIGAFRGLQKLTVSIFENDENWLRNLRNSIDQNFQLRKIHVLGVTSSQTYQSSEQIDRQEDIPHKKQQLIKKVDDLPISSQFKKIPFISFQINKSHLNAQIVRMHHFERMILLSVSSAPASQPRSITITQSISDVKDTHIDLYRSQRSGVKPIAATIIQLSANIFHWSQGDTYNSARIPSYYGNFHNPNPNPQYIGELKENINSIP
ncbi:hypothetical protein FGO68_gene9326 [Halteria grandinella]|uniref:Uncharacterized protein n=1 Tax=Halteria grandinella TaxID=5974 RepID=A0A8J8T7E7_HALGN|nr:hypothetical protein FGO68_gene9326 [Halteria grandinella]